MTSRVDFDVEVLISYDESQPDFLANCQSATLVVEHRTARSMALRLPESEASDTSGEDAVMAYLRALKSLGFVEHLRGCMLRLGCFFDTEKYACWSLDISTAMSTELSSLGLAFEATLYPCRSDEPEA